MWVAGTPRSQPADSLGPPRGFWGFPRRGGLAGRLPEQVEDDVIGGADGLVSVYSASDHHERQTVLEEDAFGDALVRKAGSRETEDRGRDIGGGVRGGSLVVELHEAVRRREVANEPRGQEGRPSVDYGGVDGGSREVRGWLSGHV